MCIYLFRKNFGNKICRHIFFSHFFYGEIKNVKKKNCTTKKKLKIFSTFFPSQKYITNITNCSQYLHSIYTAELPVIKEAIYHETSNQSESFIITDWKGSIQGILHCIYILHSKNPIIKSIRDQTISFENGVSFCWVPSYTVVQLNEKQTK